MRLFNRFWRFLIPVGLFALLAGCAAPVSAPTPAAAVSPAPSATPAVLTLALLFPKTDTQVEMGQPARFIVQVLDSTGQAVKDAAVILTVSDAQGQPAGEIAAAFGSGDVYRGAAWSVPHRRPEGTWQIQVRAVTATAQGELAGSFQVRYSTSEMLMHRYGFWLDAPDLRDIVPGLAAERGDAHNGMIRWGGVLIAQHVFPANWVEINWREGDFGLKDGDAARRFLLEQIGDLGFTPVRAVGPVEPYTFKQWSAWKVAGRPMLSVQDTIEWVVFYAPEVNKTYVIGTTLTLPPPGIDAHAALRESFEVFPELHADGKAPEALPAHLLPGPELVSPALAAQVVGDRQPVILQWKPLRELAADEFYQVSLDFNYGESNPAVYYSVRATQFTVPAKYYVTPNCHIFNWRVTLMRKTAVGEEALSHPSLYSYFQWVYPPGEKETYALPCPNAQN